MEDHLKLFLLHQLGGKTPLIHRFVLGNTTETPLTMRFEAKAPFKIISTEPPPSAKTSRSQASGNITIKPAKTLEVSESTIKYVILGSFGVFGLTAAKLWLIQIYDICMGNHNKVSLASLSCFSQNSDAYNFSSNENMTLKLHIMAHFDSIFLVIQLFL